MKTFEELFSEFKEIVIYSYMDVYNTLEDFQDAPDLMVVYDNFYGECLDNVVDFYECVFGDATSIDESLMNDLGGRKEDIPSILFVCKCLNILHLPYVYLGVYYGFFYNKVLPRIRSLPEDVI